MNPIYAHLVVLPKLLGNLEKWLDKAEAHAKARSFDVNVLLGARFAPDMLPLVSQIRIACDWAKFGYARLAGKEPPVHADGEQTLPELRARIRSVLSYIATFQESDFEGAEHRVVPLRFLPGHGALGLDFLTETVLANFYFHLTTTYDLLRHNGVELGKRDFIGALKIRPL